MQLTSTLESKSPEVYVGEEFIKARHEGSDKKWNSTKFDFFSVPDVCSELRVELSELSKKNITVSVKKDKETSFASICSRNIVAVDSLSEEQVALESKRSETTLHFNQEARELNECIVQLCREINHLKVKLKWLVVENDRFVDYIEIYFPEKCDLRRFEYRESTIFPNLATPVSYYREIKVSTQLKIEKVSRILKMNKWQLEALSLSNKV